MLVSIGIPTYNRAATLVRALDSALGQSHGSLEVLVYDNASQDGTKEIGRRYAARDERVRYVRHERNIGPTANFNRLFEACRGEYVLMLADDDWLDPDYVAACLRVLRSDPQVALAGGRARYVRDGRFVHDGVWHEHLDPDPGTRVRAYLERVDDNGIFYGLMPRHVLQRARPLPNVLGNDWLHVARIAFQGRIQVLQNVHVHRELGGTSADVASILRTFGRSSWQQRAPQLVIAFWVLRDIAWGHPVYHGLRRRDRWLLAVRAALASVRWRDLAWHVVTPTLDGLRRRSRGRFVWAAYDRFTRGLGAGQRP